MSNNSRSNEPVEGENRRVSKIKLKVQYWTEGMNVQSEFFYTGDEADTMYEAIGGIIVGLKFAKNPDWINQLLTDPEH